MKTWKVLELGIEPVGAIALICPHCGTDAEMPVGKTDSPIIAAFGLSVIFDNPKSFNSTPFLPTTIKCRTCRRIFTARDEEKTA